ncbi:MAG: SepM family pheromone-processing serine protease [Bacilli bacterium]
MSVIKMMKERLQSIFIAILFVAVLLTGLAFIPLPFYVTMPGSVQSLEPFVEVEEGTKSDGTFMLTTVSVGRANIYTYLMPIFNKYYELERMDHVLQEGESQADYNERQFLYMGQAQRSALKVAYNAANEPLTETFKGVYVLGVTQGMPAYGHLKVGDMVTAVDGQPLKSSEAFINYVGSKKKTDKVTISYVLNGKKDEVTLGLKPLPVEPVRYGIGINLDEAVEMKTERKVDFNIDEIGGPSAGLMFSLEIYDQLMKEDWTHGRKIAGTGTIDEEGNVGPIGGIEQKIVAADKSDVEIFFVPNESGSPYSNFKAAEKTVKDIGSKMTLVPVDTFEDAIAYLRKL